MIERSRKEIEDQLDMIDPDQSAGAPSRWPGMSYEQGVENALRWALGDWDDPPMED